MAAFGQSKQMAAIPHFGTHIPYSEDYVYSTYMNGCFFFNGKLVGKYYSPIWVLRDIISVDSEWTLWDGGVKT